MGGSKMMRQKFNAEIKARVALEAIKGFKTVPEISSEFKVHPTQIASWKRKLLAGAKDLFSGKSGKDIVSYDQEIGELYKKIGQLKVENDFLKKAVYPH
jgi:transposase-like protein